MTNKINGIDVSECNILANILGLTIEDKGK